MGYQTKVLVVEDEIIIARELQELLDGMGYEVVGIAATADEAIRLYSENQPDLVLMDIIIKGSRDGIDTARELQERWNATIVFVTAHSDEFTVARAKSLSPNGYVLKPIKARELQIQLEVANFVRQSNLKLLETVKWLGAILNTMDGGVIVTGMDDGVKWVNTAMADMLGASIPSILGKKAGEFLKTDRNNPSKVSYQDESGSTIETGISLKNLADTDGNQIGYLYLLE